MRPTEAAQSPITGTGTNAATNPTKWTREQTRALVGRIKDHARRGGFEIQAWQVRNMLTILRESGQVRERTDEEIVRALMAAPWWPKPRTRTWRVGEGGGWGVRS